MNQKITHLHLFPPEALLVLVDGDKVVATLLSSLRLQTLLLVIVPGQNWRPENLAIFEKDSKLRWKTAEVLTLSVLFYALCCCCYVAPSLCLDSIRGGSQMTLIQILFIL